MNKERYKQRTKQWDNVRSRMRNEKSQEGGVYCIVRPDVKYLSLTVTLADVCPGNRYITQRGVGVNVRPSEFEYILFPTVL